MIKTNEKFLEFVERFRLFEEKGELEKQELGYKKELINGLNAALSEYALQEADFAEKFAVIFRRFSNSIVNLTYRNDYDDFKNFLEKTDSTRLTNLFRELFDEERSLADRFVWFKDEINADYKQLLERDKKITNSLIALFLTVRFPNEYTFYRPSMFNHFCKVVGLEKPTAKNSTGESYAQYVEVFRQIQTALSEVLGHPVDLIETHSFLWIGFNYDRQKRKEKKGWREILAEWVQSHSRTIPAEAEEIRQEFISRFPKEELPDLTIEQYALGLNNPDSFCNWLERKAARLGSIRGSTSAKFGVWMSGGNWAFNRKYTSAEDAFAQIKTGLLSLIKAADEDRFADLDHTGLEDLGVNRHGLRIKPLTMYFPDKFLSIFSKEHIKHFFKVFELDLPSGDMFTYNRKLLDFFQSQPEFTGFDTYGMMRFVYENFDPRSESEHLNKKGIWKIAPGRRAEYWDFVQTRDCIAIGWQELGDLTAFTDKKEVSRALEDLGEGTGGATQLWDFARNVQPGDIVIANKGLNSVVGIGLISSDYISPDDDDNPCAEIPYQNVRMVDWLINEPITLDTNIFAQSTVTPLEIRRWLQIKQAYQSAYPNMETTFTQLEEGLDIEELKEQKVKLNPAEVPSELKPLMEISERTSNILLYGPPGTGKTWLVNHFTNYYLLYHNASPAEANEYWQSKDSDRHSGAVNVQEEVRHSDETKEINESFITAITDKNDLPFEKQEEFAEFVTFHQSFAYEEFIEGLRPVLVDETGVGDQSERQTVNYQISKGIFRQICGSAENAWREHGKDAPKYILVIDEINRANIAKVLGELITLIEDDKRLGEKNEITVRLPYSKKRFGVPPNLLIVGTMNTADRSIALLDIALRRRFTFVEMPPQPGKLPDDFYGVNLQRLLNNINERITFLIDADHQIGHSYLLGLETAKDLYFAWYHRIVPLLQEYFYHDVERLRAVIGEIFIEPVPVPKSSSDLFDVENQKYRLAKLGENELLAALAGLTE